MAATGDVLDIVGEQDVPLSLRGRNNEHTFYVSALPIKTDRILGMDFLSTTGATWISADDSLSCGDAQH
jgi:hypothetical protein